jgi:hypothetical protein
LEERWHRTLLVGGILALACAALFHFAPTNGDFYWQDAPRHALNGVFFKDFFAELPWRDPIGWAQRYYVRYPALTVMFYPPFFYIVEAAAFAIFGVSHEVAQLTVAGFAFFLGLAGYLLARKILPVWASLGVALILIGAPEFALWGRQVMLEIPACATELFSIYFFVNYIEARRPRDIYVSAVFFVVSIYTKQTVALILPAFLVAIVYAHGWRALRDKHLLLAALTGVIALAPEALITLKIGGVNAASAINHPGDLPRTSLRAWFFYGSQLPGQLGIITVVAAAWGLVLAVRGKLKDRWLWVFMAAWFAVGYLLLSAISLRESRYDLMILYPVILLAACGLHQLLGEKLPAQLAVFALGLGTLAYSLAFVPPAVVGGYRAVADYVARNAPKDGLVVYSGYRDANFIFDTREHGERGDLSILRADKLLLRMAVERQRGVEQTSYSEAEIEGLLKDYGVGMIVAQIGFWDDLEEMRRFNHLLQSADYRQVAVFPLSGDVSSNDGRWLQGGARVAIYEPTYPVERKVRDITIEMPFIKDRFTGHVN